MSGVKPAPRQPVAALCRGSGFTPDRRYLGPNQLAACRGLKPAPRQPVAALCRGSGFTPDRRYSVGASSS